MMERVDMVLPPTRKQQLVLRVMILIGLFSMAFFLNRLLHRSIISCAPLYWLLIGTFVFTCFKILYEWYHYFYITVLPTPTPTKTYTVDIFTTFCAGEPYDMMVETLTALQAITYPHNTYLCDEANDPYLKGVCAELGVHHVTRTVKLHAKAGNINNALMQSTGELCVVLDPDHVPVPGFLDPIVSHFNDPEIGFVQIVQAYKNHDESLIAKGAAQQTYQFYGPMMMTMNRYSTVLAIGANCTFRRTALESIDGHAAGLAEDMHTAMQLHAKGWKSVYVPAVLARGLVPATLSAYYKQQLKWSRGVFELLVTSYPRLFKKFTWRQKLHYGIIPFYYLSGVIFLINFLVPLISLFGDVYPLKLGLDTFVLIGLPLVISTVLIRHYVQRWVMEDNERGFHVVGGLLLIGTWWVFILGLVYTLIRKNVPYIPTPKEASDEKNLRINLPNIVVLVLSLVAIGYGLYHDWNPFTFVMAAIAGTNCLFMVFILLASEQLKWKVLTGKHQRLGAAMDNVGAFKRKFWLARRWIYGGVRSVSLMLVVITVCLSLYVISGESDSGEIQHVPLVKNDLFLSGVFAPGDTSSSTGVKAYERAFGMHFDIVSFYVPWGSRVGCFPVSLPLEGVYKGHSIPLIFWEPWKALFTQRYAAVGSKASSIFEQISGGQYDDYIMQVALQIKELKRPVFLCFAPEADNPACAWFDARANGSAYFKTAWTYVHDLFEQQHVYNVIWVWKPWKAEAADDYFPDRSYVDWVGVSAGGQIAGLRPDAAFDSLYKPFHQFALAQRELPFMVLDVVRRDSVGSVGDWWKGHVQHVKSRFPEIKALVFSGGGEKSGSFAEQGMAPWGVQQVAQLSSSPGKAYVPVIAAVAGVQLPGAGHSFDVLFAGVRGVNYSKGQHWFKNVFPLTKKLVLSDFEEMRAVGINAVKWTGPNVYDRVMLEVAHQTNMQVHYSFWVPDGIDFITDEVALASLQHTILDFVQEHRLDKQIVSWNLGNNTLQELDQRFYKPALFYQQQAYFAWVGRLIKDIKATDPDRPVSMDVLVDRKLSEVTGMLADHVVGVDAYGLVLTDTLCRKDQLDSLGVPYFFSSANAKAYLHLKKPGGGVFVEDWQDQETASAVTFNGLKDVYGRNKGSLYELGTLWQGHVERHNLPLIRILRPASTPVYGDMLEYHALVYKYNWWQLAENAEKAMNFEWYLVGLNAQGFATSMKMVGTGTTLQLGMPKDILYYKLYLIGSEGKNVVTAFSSLNLPLGD